MNEVINKSIVSDEVNLFMDNVEDIMINEMATSGDFHIVELPLRHFFTEGLYAREMSAPAGSYITSKIHKTEHIFIVSKGRLSVWDDDGGEVVITAPFMGITKAGTRRLAYVHEDLIWTTFHANPDNEDEIKIEERIIEKHENKLLTSHKNLQLCHS